MASKIWKAIVVILGMWLVTIAIGATFSALHINFDQTIFTIITVFIGIHVYERWIGYKSE